MDMLFCFSCKRINTELFNLATEVDYDGIPFNTKLSSFIYRKLEDRCEKNFCKTCLTQISTIYNFIRNLLEQNAVSFQFINYVLNKNPSADLPMKISYAGYSQFECERSEEINKMLDSLRRQSIPDASVPRRKKSVNLTRYFQDNSDSRHYSSRAESIYGSSVDLAEIPFVYPFDDACTDELRASGLSEPDRANLSEEDENTYNCSPSPKRNRKTDNSDKYVELVRSPDCSNIDANSDEDVGIVESIAHSRKDTHEDVRVVGSTGRNKKYEDVQVVKSARPNRRDVEIVESIGHSRKDTHEDVRVVGSTGRNKKYKDVTVVKSARPNRRDAYNLSIFFDDDSGEENEPFFVDDETADPNYKTGRSLKKMATPSRRRSVSKSPGRKRSKSPGESIKMQCAICGKSYNKNWYENHLKTHSNIFAYQCNVCQQKFKIKVYLNKHMKIHEEKSLIKCAVCSGVFQGINTLKEHIIALHEDVFRPAVCKLCDKDCKNPVNLNSHIAKHHIWV